MGIKKFKPTTPTLRKKQVMDSKDLTKGVRIPGKLLEIKKTTEELQFVTKVAV
jgi:large subunit ribosomal protein L2